MVTLQTVEIPGLREAIKREARVRDTAFLDGMEIVCGVEVHPLSLRRLIWLEQAKNGFIVPFRFDSDDEFLAHALQVIYFCTPAFKMPTTPKTKLLDVFWEGYRQNRFFAKALRSGTPKQIVEDIKAWIGDAFMDTPAGGGSNEVPRPSYVSYPASIVDKFAEAGFTFTYDEIMDMPLVRLWQFWRLAGKRLNSLTLTNPSDDIAVNHIAGVKL